MYYYSGYTIPLTKNEVYTLLEFKQLRRGETLLLASDFILHSYLSGEVQYEFMIDNTVYMYTQDDLDKTRACLRGQFRNNEDDIIYRLSLGQVCELQTTGRLKLWGQDDDHDVVALTDFVKYNLGNNYKYVSWVGDVIIYFYQTDISI